MSYRVRKDFLARVGFSVNADDVVPAATLTNGVLSALPASLFRSLDYKTTSAILGSVFCENLADRTQALVNPIEKGHPDIVPRAAAKATEAQLRNYPSGLDFAEQRALGFGIARNLSPEARWSSISGL